MRLRSALLVLLAAAASVPSARAQCTGEFRFRSQIQIDAYASAPCIAITGTVLIDGPDITDLQPLGPLQQISLSLRITNNTKLTSLAGLDNLTSIGGLLHIEGNSALRSLAGLSGLQTVGDGLYVRRNPQLGTLGLSALTEVHGSREVFIEGNHALTSLGTFQASAGVLRIVDADSLVSLDGLAATLSGLTVRGNQKLTSLGGASGTTFVEGASLFVSDNDALTTFGDLTLPAAFGSLAIDGNPLLANLDALASIRTLGGGSAEGLFTLYDNDALTNVDALAGLTTVASHVSIRENDRLVNLDGLSHLTEIGGDLSVSNNAALEDIDGLSDVTSVDGLVGITDNAVLANVDGLSGLTQIVEGLYLSRNDVLADLNGLSGVTAVGGSLSIRSNPRLRDLTGLGALTSVGQTYTFEDPGDLSVRDNTGLLNVDALASVTEIRGDLRVTGNAALRLCSCGLYPVISTNGVGQSLLIADNAEGCATPDDIVETTCSTASAPRVEPAALALWAAPNPARDEVRLTLELAVAGNVRVVAYDALGREVAVLHDGPMAAGSHVVPFETAALPAGVYVARAEAGGLVATQTLTVAR